MEYDTICMSGGGVKGFAFIGALDYLNKKKIINIDNIKNWVGTSIGSILAYAVVCGFSITEMENFIIEFDFTKTNPDISIDNIFISHGISDGKRAEFILRSFIQHKFNIDDITFLELYKLTQKNLLIIGTNFTHAREELFSHNTTPDMSVVTAVRISMSIPVFFTPVLYNNCYYVDGSITNNFPIKHCDKYTTIGLYIRNNNDTCNNEITSIVSIIIGCMNIISDTINHKDINMCDNIVQIDNYKHEFINFDFTIETKMKLLKLGHTYAKKFIKDMPRKICVAIINKIIDDVCNLI
jgi:predicted acylesterase/phospholipase RssA